MADKPPSALVVLCTLSTTVDTTSNTIIINGKTYIATTAVAPTSSTCMAFLCSAHIEDIDSDDSDVNNLYLYHTYLMLTSPIKGSVDWSIHSHPLDISDPVPLAS